MTNKQSTTGLFDRMWAKKVEFFLVFFGVMTITYGVLFAVDFIPEPITESDEVVSEEMVEQENTTITPTDARDTSEVDADESDTDPEVEPGVESATTVVNPNPPAPLPSLDATPNRIIIDKLGKDVAVLNPNTRSIAGLDNALLNGVVRHPDSADFANDGTMFLFGHSSYLPNVINKNFQAFNGLKDLTWGDRIRVQSNDMEYVYRVDRVYEVQASDAEVAIERGEAKLTLATCNTFGSKDDRFIVESTLIESYPLE